jgi:hypothetical protein
LSLSNGPGQEKIFEIFVTGNSDYTEVLFKVHKDYCPALYTLLGVEPSEPYAKILFREIVHWEEDMPEFFFCNWIASGASKNMASIYFGTYIGDDLLHFGALVLSVLKCILNMNDDEDEDDEDPEPPRGRFQFLRSSA